MQHRKNGTVPASLTDCTCCGAAIPATGMPGRPQEWCDDCQPKRDTYAHDRRRRGRERRRIARRRLERSTAGLHPNGWKRKVRKFVAADCAVCSEPFVSPDLEERTCSDVCERQWEQDQLAWLDSMDGDLLARLDAECLELAKAA